MDDVVDVGGCRIEVVVGDITDQPDLAAVVNAANAQLKTGGGVAGAIHRVAGPELEREAAPLGPISPGQCVRTGAHGLPNAHVLHCLGPVYGQDHPAEELLAACYHNALRIADEAGINSVGFPAISTGAFGFPMGPAAEVATTTVVQVVPALANVELVRFVLFDEASYHAHVNGLAAAVAND